MKNSNEKIAQYHLHKAHPERMQFEIYDLNEYRNKSIRKAAIPHSHSYYQIIWFYNEGGTHTVDFKTYDIKKNTLLFINKDQIHAFDDNLKVQGRLIHFNESFFMHAEVDIFLKYHLFNSAQNPIYLLNQQHSALASSYISLMQQELQNRNAFGNEEVIRFLLKSLLIILERVHHSAVGRNIALTDNYEIQYYKFKELLEENYFNNLSVNAYAELLSVSSKTLATIVKHMVGKSPSEVITERIILQAKRLLKFTALQIQEIAFQLGFSDDSYFVKYFKRHVGVSPNAFRNSLS